MKPRLLFLCQTFPYPPDGGVWIRSSNVLRILSRVFQVHALCFERMGENQRQGRYDLAHGIDELSRFAKVETFPIPQAQSRTRFVWDHLRSVANRRVYTRYLYASSALARRIAELRKAVEFDLVHVDSMDLAAYLPAVMDLPTVCVHHNVESSLLRRRANVEGGLVGRYYELQGALMEREERRWAPRVTLNVMVSRDDRATLDAMIPGVHARIIPNGVDVDEFRPEEPQANEAIVHMGGTNWFPNLDALKHFCSDILPCLREQGFDPPVRWVGSSSQKEREYYARTHRVELTGYLDDVRPAMRDSLCNVVPLRIGGGTRLKILNSWAMARPVVSTSIGCEGLDARDGHNILIRDDPGDFARAILELRDDPDLCRRIGAGARQTVEETYSWEVIGGDMNRMYESLLKSD